MTAKPIATLPLYRSTDQIIYSLADNKRLWVHGAGISAQICIDDVELSIVKFEGEGSMQFRVDFGTGASGTANYASLFFDEKYHDKIIEAFSAHGIPVRVEDIV